MIYVETGKFNILVYRGSVTVLEEFEYRISESMDLERRCLDSRYPVWEANSPYYLDMTVTDFNARQSFTHRKSMHEIIINCTKLKYYPIKPDRRWIADTLSGSGIPKFIEIELEDHHLKLKEGDGELDVNKGYTGQILIDMGSLRPKYASNAALLNYMQIKRKLS